MRRNSLLAQTIQNTIAISAWIILAIAFNKWWIALFSILFMTRYRYFRFCDKCGKRAPYANSYHDALKRAKEIGWIHCAETNEDYCPECQKLLEEESKR